MYPITIVACKYTWRRTVALVGAVVFVLTTPKWKVLKLYCGYINCSCIKSITRSRGELSPEWGWVRKPVSKGLCSIIPPLLCVFPAQSSIYNPFGCWHTRVQIWSKNSAEGSAAHTCLLADTWVWFKQWFFLSLGALMWIFLSFPDAGCHAVCTSSCLWNCSLTIRIDWSGQQA